MVNKIKKIDRIVYIAIIMYILDILFLGTGQIVKQLGIPTRMIFFSIAVLGSVPGILPDYKKFLKNKYCIVVLSFMVLVAINMVRGYFRGNNLSLIVMDVKGFLNLLIVFPMLYALNTKERILKLIKIMVHSLSIVSVITLMLSFYAKFSENMQDTIYTFLNGYKMCSISFLNENVTRIFFHTASRWFFLGVMLALVLTIIEKQKRILWVFEMSLLMSGILVSFTRAFYLGVFISIFVLVVFVAMYYKEYFLYMLKKALAMSVITVLIVSGIGVGVNDNLFQVAIERCLLSMSDTNSEGEMDEDSVGGSDKTEEDSVLTNTLAELENLNIRELRKETALKNISRNPVFGLGLGVANDPEEGIIEYFYLDLCSKMGLLGVAIFLLPYVLCVQDIIRKRKQMSNHAILNLTVNLALLFLLVISYFNPCMNTTVGLSIYCLSIAISCANEENVLEM